MKRMFLLCVTAMSLTAVLCSCGNENHEAERSWPTTVEYSHLNDPETRQLLEDLLEAVPVAERERRVLFQKIDEINSYLKPEELTDGFEERSITETLYDPYEIQERWEADHPDFPGYNCRITAFSLMNPLIRLDVSEDLSDQDAVMMDLVSLEEDGSAFRTEAQWKQFVTFYAGIETEDTKDTAVHVEQIQNSWGERGVSFLPGGASLISVFLHDQIDGDRLFIGHTGILMESEGQLYFLEKLSFQEPYQLVQVDSRGELSDYLMTKYDVEFNQPTASPIILENDELLEGYRVRPPHQPSGEGSFEPWAE